MGGGREPGRWVASASPSDGWPAQARATVGRREPGHGELTSRAQGWPRRKGTPQAAGGKWPGQAPGARTVTRMDALSGTLRHAQDAGDTGAAAAGTRGR